MGQIAGWYNSAWFPWNQLCSFMLTDYSLYWECVCLSGIVYTQDFFTCYIIQKDIEMIKTWGTAWDQ